MTVFPELESVRVSWWFWSPLGTAPSFSAETSPSWFLLLSGWGGVEDDWAWFSLQFWFNLLSDLELKELPEQLS